MRMFIESVKERRQEKDGQIYQTFAVKQMIGPGVYQTIRRFRFMNDSQSVILPSCDKGGHYSTDVEQSPKLLAMVTELAREYFALQGDSGEYIPAPTKTGNVDDTTPKLLGAATSEGLSEQEHDRLRMIACANGARTQEEVEAWIKNHLRKKRNKR